MSCSAKRYGYDITAGHCNGNYEERSPTSRGRRPVPQGRGLENICVRGSTTDGHAAVLKTSASAPRPPRRDTAAHKIANRLTPVGNARSTSRVWALKIQ